MCDAKARAGGVKIQTAVAQIKPRKGDYACNLRRVGDLFAQLEEDAPDTDVLVLPETVLSGYFLEGGVRDVARTREQLFDDLLRVYRERVTRPDAMLDLCLGFYELGDGKYYNSALYATLTAQDREQETGNREQIPDSSFILHPSSFPGIRHVHRKFFLPTYGVFDEKRFVSRGRSISAFPTRFGKAAVLICEDVWHSISATIAALKGAQVIYIISASPGREFTGQHLGNVARWNVLLPGIADEHNVWVVYSGLVGFEGGKGFTGSSQVIDPFGNTKVQGSVIDECLVRATIDLEDVAIARAVSPLLADLEAALGDVTMELEQIARRPHLE
jgi:predicted amidohydrolase